MEQLQDFYNRHFQSCVFEGDENAYEVAFAAEIASFAQRLRETHEGEEVERAWQAPNVSEF
eukprot:12817512-Alexandrium_andersonii.AAC.1